MNTFDMVHGFIAREKPSTLTARESLFRKSLAANHPAFVPVIVSRAFTMTPE